MTIDPRSVFQLACKFAATEMHVRQRSNPKAAFMATPSMALSAFAIELFLKCLLLLEGKDLDRIHTLNVYFGGSVTSRSAVLRKFGKGKLGPRSIC
jgi:hypothetical protein